MPILLFFYLSNILNAGLFTSAASDCRTVIITNMSFTCNRWVLKTRRWEPASCLRRNRCTALRRWRGWSSDALQSFAKCPTWLRKPSKPSSCRSASSRSDHLLFFFLNLWFILNVTQYFTFSFEKILSTHKQVKREMCSCAGWEGEASAGCHKAHTREGSCGAQTEVLCDREYTARSNTWGDSMGGESWVICVRSVGFENFQHTKQCETLNAAGEMRDIMFLYHKRRNPPFIMFIRRKCTKCSLLYVSEYFTMLPLLKSSSNLGELFMIFQLVLQGGF